MDTWDELMAQAAETPDPRLRVAVLQRAVDAADAEGDIDRAFVSRMDLIGTTYYTDQTLLGLAAFAWCLARYDEDPERFARHRQDLGWTHKWMPAVIRGHATVPLTRVESMIDDLERRHVADGAGTRQAVAERIKLRIASGVGAPLDELLTDWRASSTTSLTDCPACEINLEADALLTLGDDDAAFTVLEPVLTGEVEPCGSGPQANCAMAVPLLLDQGLDVEAVSVFEVALRRSRGQARSVDTVARLAALMARTGDQVGARRLALGQLRLLDDAGTPEKVMEAAASFARALAGAAADEPVGPTVIVPAVLGDAPVGGWTVPAVAAALRSLAVDAAARFDERNGTDTVGRTVAATLAAPDRAPTVLRRGHRPAVPADPDRVLAEIAPLDPGPSPLAAAGPAAPSTPAPAAADGADAYLRWSFDRLDAWSFEAVHAEAVRRWTTDTDAGQRAAAAVWTAGTDDGPSLDELTALTSDTNLTAAVRSALAAETASIILRGGGDPMVAVACASAAVGEAQHGDVPARIALSSLREAIVVLGAAGADDSREDALAVARGLAADQDRTGPEAVLAARIEMDEAERRLRADDAEPAALIAAAARAADAAVACLDRRSLPMAVHTAIEAGQRLLGLDQPAAALPALRRALEAVPSGAGVTPIRFQACLTLADAVSAIEGPAAAMVPQRAAIEAVRDLGPTPMQGWARRGLAFQLQAVGRLDEAVVQFASAGELLAAGGDPVTVWSLDLARARAELQLGDTARAADRADRVLAAVDAAETVDAGDRIPLSHEALEILIDAAWEDEDLPAAERSLTRLADSLVALDLPAGLARSSSARALAAQGDHEGALVRFDQAEREVGADDRPGRDHELATIAGRRAEVLWWSDRNDEAAELATEVYETIDALGDEPLAVRVLAVAARARHDAFQNEVNQDGSGIRRRGDEAESTLIHAIQLAHAAEETPIAEELEARLQAVREAVDALGDPGRR